MQPDQEKNAASFGDKGWPSEEEIQRLIEEAEDDVRNGTKLELPAALVKELEPILEELGEIFGSKK